MNNSTEHILANKTAALSKWQRVSTMPYLISVLCTIWTIGANLFIIACFFRNRRRKWTSFTRQTCSMTVSDLLVGLTAVPILVVELKGGCTNALVCFVTFHLFFSIQCVTLFHVLGVCIFRSISLKTFTDPIRRSSKFTYATCVILVSWMVPGVIILVPFVAWGQYTHGQMYCSIDTIFDKNFGQAMRFIAISYFVSQCLTNLLYIITFCRVWLLIRTVVPIDAIQMEGTLGPSQTSEGSMQTSRPSCTSRRHVVNTVPTTNPPCPSINTLRSQKRVFVTIGILLLMFNVFTFPLTASLFVVSSQSITRNIRFIVCTLFVVNSGLNPIVYATRIASLKTAVYTTLREIGNLLRF